MLKNVIASILIPALLIQIVGCTSTKELTVNDLKQVSGSKVIKVRTWYSEEYLLQNPPEKAKTHRWGIDEDYIYIYSNWPKNIGNGQIKIITDTVKIPLSSIETIETNSFDFGQAILWIISISGIMLLVFIFAAEIAVSSVPNN